MDHGHQEVELNSALRECERQANTRHVFRGKSSVGIGLDRTRLDEPGNVVRRGASLTRQAI